MHKIFKHSGKLGDIIYALPSIKAMGGGIIAINTGKYLTRQDVEFIKPLLMWQPYIEDVVEFEYVLGTSNIINMDGFRSREALNETNLILSQGDALGVDLGDWQQPWMVLPPSWIQPAVVPFSLIHNSGRYDQAGFDWIKEIDGLKSPYFIGIEKEHTGVFESVPMFAKIDNALTMAQVIQMSEVISCNQSLGLAIAQAIGHPYRLMVADGHTNCIMGTENETLLW